MAHPQLDLSNDQLLSTTRAVRKRLDLERPVERSVVDECLELALQAPTGSNAQGWHFMVVTDEAKRRRLGELYAKAFEGYAAMPQSAANVHADDPSMEATQERVMSSASYLAEVLGQVPVHVIPCVAGRVENVPMVIAQASIYGSILPAAWSFMLAARARGLGTCWTTLHLMHEKEAAELLGIPFDEITQCALIPLAYTKGTDFKPGPRKAMDGIIHYDQW
ncbi:MAG: nitroreductase family protein [Myxococcota bacterium]|nr:nitroreductase family protein [Myxococcota bacterium]